MGANLKEVRERIKSVNNKQQIHKAMKMVSAAKLRRAQEAITQLRPYAEKLNELLVNILSNIEGDFASGYSEEREVKRALIFLITSNKGLAGAFNSNLIKQAVEPIENEYSELLSQGNLAICPIGKKGFEYVQKHYPEARIIEDFVYLFDDLSFDNIGRVADIVMKRFTDGFYDKVDVVYSEFKNPAVQLYHRETYLPVETVSSEEETVSADYIFEPDKESLLEHLIPSIMQIRFQRYLLDTHASEHGARMTAMDNATENANELLNDLKITYNKARQEAITREISEIVGGAAALEG